MIRIEPAPSVIQHLFCPTERRRRPHRVQKFVRTRYKIDAHATRLPKRRRASLWGALAGLFRGTA